MPVTLRLPAALATAAGGETLLEARAGTVGEIVAELAARHPRLGARLRRADGGPLPYVLFYLGGDDVRFREGFATQVPDGAELVVVPAIAGG